MSKKSIREHLAFAASLNRKLGKSSAFSKDIQARFGDILIGKKPKDVWNNSEFKVFLDQTWTGIQLLDAQIAIELISEGVDAETATRIATKIVNKARSFAKISGAQSAGVVWDEQKKTLFFSQFK